MTPESATLLALPDPCLTQKQNPKDSFPRLYLLFQIIEFGYCCILETPGSYCCILETPGNSNYLLQQTFLQFPS
ncbi:hypothetical protein DPMN_043742 [Dreissena polymorpha]|uniref:Uncharacterized protein n=1 Tax=Dreissena polymorpha TaxID=45954 RepID=A0A9D4D4L9_DREPO|nr:hypothetical protein DPMN_043742 [Dreissena polymorpha]